MRIADYFEKAVSGPHRPFALVEGDQRVTFEQALETVHAIANAMDDDAAIRPGAHVAVYSPNHWMVPLVLLAINRSDRVRLPVHTRNAVEVNREVLSFFACEVLFFHSRFEVQVAQLLPSLPRIVRTVCIDRPSAHGVFLDDWCAGSRRPYVSAMEDPLAAAQIQPTGGTTGPSKGAVYTHRSQEMNFINGKVTSDPKAEHTYLAVAPLTHAGGAVAMNTLCCGNTVVVLADTAPARILDAIRRWEVTHFFTPPTLLYSLLAEFQRQPVPLPSLRKIMVGAAPVAPEKVKEATRLLGPVVYESYGQTESGAPLTVKAPADYIRADGSFDEAVLASAGRAADFVRVEIMDAQGRLLPPGERGEVVVRGSSLMREYFENPDETRSLDLHGWRHTGDVGVKDARGFITIVDRIKDMIVTGGFNVFPAPIEKVILEHDAVQECAVVGVPDDKWGEALKAVVELKPGRRLGEDEVIALCRDRLGGVHAPKSVEFWPELPRSAVGKTLRRQVRERFWKDSWRAV